MDELRERLEALRLQAAPQRRYRYFTPLELAVDELVETAQVPIDKRIYTGLDDFDGAMRGLRPGELCTVTAYAHQGKTVFATHVMHHNKDKRMVMFTMDETRPLVLSKLVSLVHNISAEEVEARLFDRDEDTEKLVRDTVSEHFPYLAIFDNLYTLGQMADGIREVSDHWGDSPQLVVLDYLSLLQGNGDDDVSKFNTVKPFGKDHGVPLMVLHQSSRTKGREGQKVTIDSGAYGGEQQSMFLIGVRRKRFFYSALVDELERKLAVGSKNHDLVKAQLDDAREQLKVHRDTITFNLVKNKRPPSQLVEDLDLHLDGKTGRVSEFISPPKSRFSSVDDVMAYQAWERRQTASYGVEEEEF
jgi:KaiC/GvpD/RAD55 family RecA-like ATPase